MVWVAFQCLSIPVRSLAETSEPEKCVAVIRMGKSTLGPIPENVFQMRYCVRGKGGSRVTLDHVSRLAEAARGSHSKRGAKSKQPI